MAESSESQERNGKLIWALMLVSNRVLLGSRGANVWEAWSESDPTQDELIAWVRSGKGRALSLKHWQGLAEAGLGELSQLAEQVLEEVQGTSPAVRDETPPTGVKSQPEEQRATPQPRQPDPAVNKKLAEHLRDSRFVQRLKAGFQEAEQDSTAQTAAKDWFHQGGEAFLALDLREAEACWQKSVEADPNYSYAYAWLGTVYKYDDEPRRSLDYCNQAIARNQGLAYAYKERGNAYLDLKEYERAIADYNQAIKLDPDYVHPYNGRGNAYRQLKEYERAIADFNQAIKLDPDFADAYNGRGLAYSDLKEYERAIADCTKAIELDPNFAGVYHNRGIVYFDLKEYEKAIADYDQAIKFDPDCVNAYNGRGNAYRYLKEYEKAIADYDQAIKLGPDYVSAYNNRGNAYLDLKEHERAVQDYDQALALQPDCWEAWAMRGQALLSHSSYRAALDNYHSGLSHLDPQRHSLGCAILHRQTGLAHAQQSRNSRQPSLYRQANRHYASAYDLIQANPLYSSNTLEILRDWIKADRALGEWDAANELTLNAIQRLERLLQTADPQYRKLLRQQFCDFYHLNVDHLIQQNQPWAALREAETWKTLALQWLGTDDADPQPPPDLAQQINQLPPQTAILYWHLSPAQITTFLLRPHQDPHIFTLPCDPPGNPQTQAQTNFSQWLKSYSQLYQQQRKTKPTDPLAEPASPSTWRQQLPQRLKHLKQILKIRQIEEQLDPNDSLILIPHRDLHQLPLHSCFTPSPSSSQSRTISYRPNLSLRSSAPASASAHPPILIGHPSSQQPLEYARLETQLIQRLYPQAQPLTEAAVTPENFRQRLQTPASCFYFSGHGEHDSRTPEQSALYLADDEPFTLAELDALDSAQYPLVCLAACETGISNWGEFINEFVGFPAVFLNKGTGAVLSTLWTVSEVSSMIFTVEFFRHYQQQLQPTAALQHAQTQLRTLTWWDLARWYDQAVDPNLSLSPRKWLQSCARNIRKFPQNHPPEVIPYRHPYHWAGFILTQLGVEP